MDLDSLKGMGFDPNAYRTVSTIKELKEHIPFFVIARANRDLQAKINQKTVNFVKYSKYIMPLYIFLSLYKSKDNKNKSHFTFIENISNCYKPYNGEDLHNKSILLIRTSGYGDILFTQPICKYLREKYPTCKILFATVEEYKDIFNVYPQNLNIRKHSIPLHIRVFESADYHLIFEGCIERCLQSQTMDAYDIFKEMSGLDFDVKEYRPTLDKIQISKFDSILNSTGQYSVLQFRASSMFRTLSIEKILELCKALEEKTNDKFVFLDNDFAHSVYEEDIIDKGELSRDRFINLSKYSKTIVDACEIIHNSNCVIGIDSSFTHIAGAYGIPFVGIYSTFRGDLRTTYYDNVEIVQAKKMCEKQPCFLTDSNMRKCTQYHKKINSIEKLVCEDGIDVNEIVDKYLKLRKG